MAVHLPTETADAIFFYCDPHILANISCVSSHFNSVAERLLYATITICETLSADGPRPDRTLRCCQSLLSRRYLLHNVRKFHLRWQSDCDAPPRLALSSFCDAVNQLLPSLAHLESLELLLGPANVLSGDPMCHAIERVINRCAFERLRHCTLGADWIKGARPYTTRLTIFLGSLPCLQNLRLSDCHALVAPLPPSALHSLVAFRGLPGAAAAIVARRPVRYLGLLGQDSDITQDVLIGISSTAMPLRSLDLSAISIRPVTLRAVATHLPHIEKLRVRLGLRHTLHYAFSGIRMLTGLSAVLHCFTLLTLLDLSPTATTGYQQATAEDERCLCIEWSRACSALRRVVFPSQTSWVLSSDRTWELEMST